MKLNWDAAKPIFIIWAQANTDLVNMRYNILATYCTNTPLIYPRPVTYLSPIRMRQKYTRVNILRCANFTLGK